MNQKIKAYQAELLLLTVAIFWGTTFLITQETIKTVPIFSFLFYRFILATVLISLLSFKKLRVVDKQQIINGCLLGCILFLVFSTQTFGLDYTSSNTTAFLNGTFVIIVPILSWFLFKHTIAKNVLISSFVALIGLYLFTSSERLSIGKGEILGLICAVMLALHILFTNIFSNKNKNVYALVFFQLLTVTVLSMFFSLLFEKSTFSIKINNDLIIALTIVSIFATVYAFLMQTTMQQFTTSTKTVIIFSTTPVFSALYSYITINEILTREQLFGGALIVLSTIIAQVKIKTLIPTRQRYS